MAHLEDLCRSFASFKTEVLERLDCLKCLIQESARNSATPSTGARAPMSVASQASHLTQLNFVYLTILSSRSVAWVRDNLVQ